MVTFHKKPGDYTHELLSHDWCLLGNDKIRRQTVTLHIH